MGRVRINTGPLPGLRPGPRTVADRLLQQYAQLTLSHLAFFVGLRAPLIRNSCSENAVIMGFGCLQFIGKRVCLIGWVIWNYFL